MHWVHHLTVLTPDPEGSDRQGCYRSGAFIDEEGVPTSIYYGPPEGICLASSQNETFYPALHGRYLWEQASHR